MSPFYPLIITLGCLSSYTDIRYGTIKNRHLLWFCALALIIYAYLQINSKIVINAELLTNFLIGTAIAYIFYSLKMWGAGDAKLFIVFSLLMPTQRHIRILPFPSVILFINIFLLSMAAMIALSIYLITKNKYNLSSKISFAALGKKIIYSFFLVLGLGWIVSYLTKPLNTYFSPTMNIITIYILYSGFQNIKLLKNKIIIFAIAGCIGFILEIILQFDNSSLITLIPKLMRTTKYALTFYFINLLIYHDINKNNEKTSIPFAPFMLLGTLATNTNFIYHAISFMNFLSR